MGSIKKSLVLHNLDNLKAVCYIAKSYSNAPFLTIKNHVNQMEVTLQLLVLICFPGSLACFVIARAIWNPKDMREGFIFSLSGLLLLLVAIYTIYFASSICGADPSSLLC